MNLQQARANLISTMRVIVRALKTQEAYLRQLWSECLSFFRGDDDIFNFIDVFVGSIENQFGRAWREGARDVGVEPADMTPEDNGILDELIRNEQEFVLHLADDIEAARANQMSLADFRARFRPRLETWANRYTDIVNQARAHFGGKMRLVWELGATEEHCVTCAALNGIVAFAEEWEASGIHPQGAPNERLECGGWHCDCRLTPTSRPRTQGGVPNV